MRFHHLLVALSVLTALSATSACSSDEQIVSEGSTTTATPVTTSFEAPPAPGFDEARQVEIDPSAQEPITPVPLNSLEPGPDGRSIQLTVWGDPCTVIAAVDIAEAASEVVVTASVGRSTGADVACIEIAELLGTTVALDDPLGDRTLVDGYTP